MKVPEGFVSIKELKQTAYSVWRMRNRRKWSRTYWREAKAHCPSNTPTEWLNWLLDMQAVIFIDVFFEEIGYALKHLPECCWMHFHRRELLERILANPEGLRLMKDEYERVYHDGSTPQADRVLELEEQPARGFSLAPGS